jgi:hypothetical protein
MRTRLTIPLVQTYVSVRARKEPMPDSPTRERSSASSPRCRTSSGSSTARPRSQGPSRCCAISPVTPIVSPSRTAASLQPTTTRLRSAGRIIASTAPAAGRRCGFTRTSSSGASCCTCCSRASTASATTALCLRQPRREHRDGPRAPQCRPVCRRPAKAAAG